MHFYTDCISQSGHSEAFKNTPWQWLIAEWWDMYNICDRSPFIMVSCMPPPPTRRLNLPRYQKCCTFLPPHPQLNRFPLELTLRPEQSSVQQIPRRNIDSRFRSLPRGCTGPAMCLEFLAETIASTAKLTVWRTFFKTISSFLWNSDTL